MGKRLLQADWDEIELKMFKGQSVNSLAADYGISEAGIRKRFKSKKANAVEDAVVKTIEAKRAVEKLPQMLRLHVDTLVEIRMRISAAMAQSGELAAKTALRMSHIANLQSSKLDEEMPNGDDVRMVHALMDTANKAALIPLELIKATKGMEKPEDPQEEKGYSFSIEVVK